jgi:predicted secreted protein
MVVQFDLFSAKTETQRSTGVKGNSSASHILIGMNHRVSLMLLVAVAVLWGAPAQGGDSDNLELVGFSKDGQYVAFEAFGQHDGSGYAYAELSIARVGQNTLVSKIGSEAQSEGTEVQQIRAELAVKARGALKRYGIQPGLQGRFIGMALVSFSDVQASDFVAYGRTHTLELSSKPAAVTANCVDDQPRLLELTLTVAGKTRVLQRDLRLPASRDCAYSYEMRSAHLYGRSLAVMIAFSTPGFEGPNKRWMVVTTTLK